MLVQVFKLEEPTETDPLASFPLGKHTLGRGPTLQCNDKRVSRNHATLEVAPENIKLSSTHINPCFLKGGNSKTITILSNGLSTELNDGDNFAFLPDNFWFKVKIVNADNSDDRPEKCETNKRQLEEAEQVPDKRQKTELKVETKNATNEIVKQEMAGSSRTADEVNETTEVENTTIQEDLKYPREEIKSVEEDVNAPQDGAKSAEEDVKAPQEETKSAEEDVKAPQGDEPKSAEVKQEPESQSSNDGANAGPSVPRPRRERCWYGIECYRKNDLHRTEYSHPGDSDFESEPDDNRPVCTFGAACYRKNKDHRRDFKHPSKQRPNTVKKKRTRKKVDRLNVADSEDMHEFSDSEDPFLADDDSDEYVEESDDDDDTDWDSQNADEDSENVKRLVKEANRFVKK